MQNVSAPAPDDAQLNPSSDSSPPVAPNRDELELNRSSGAQQPLAAALGVDPALARVAQILAMGAARAALAQQAPPNPSA